MGGAEKGHHLFMWYGGSCWSEITFMLSSICCSKSLLACVVGTERGGGGGGEFDREATANRPHQ